LCIVARSLPKSRGMAPRSSADCIQVSSDARLFWFPVYSHPSGPGCDPWYVVDAGYVFRCVGHPDGPSREPSLRIVDDGLYPTAGMTVIPATMPVFRMVGSLIYPTDVHPGGPSRTPCYQAR
jgi:hypothetical protein